MTTSDLARVPRRGGVEGDKSDGLVRTVWADLRRGALTVLHGTTRRDLVRAGVVAVVWFGALELAGRVSSWFPAPQVLGSLLVVALVFVVHRLEATRDALAARDAELVTARDEHAEAEVRAERTRIARELHDVVAHHISGIVLRADAADLVADDNPAEPRAAVRAIADAGREALDAVRSVVRMLRDPADAPPPEEGPAFDAEWHPTDTMAELPAVVARVAAAGLQVDAHLPDPLPRLGAAAELAVVRIAAEALTNVLLHSQATRAELWLDVVDDRLQLGVADPGPPLAHDESSGGHGLMHMRERAASAAGTLEAGPDWPGWLVVLEVPISAPDKTGTSPPETDPEQTEEP
ncbi:MAG: histidine kinase [Micrococcales bacterium]|nr:histidine kinase [Micrococcales bacterium]MCL2668602.1 histidine kinase [Micrococcales bacterium]